jgi:hypothetical protein
LTPSRRAVRHAGISSSDAAGSPGTVDRVMRAQRGRDVVAQHRIERRQHPGPRQMLADRVGIEIAHRWRFSANGVQRLLDRGVLGQR